MKVKHTLEIKARCPVNDGQDTYRLTVTVDRLVKVEDILEAVRKLTAEPIFQEDLTRRLASELAASVHTTGRHGEVETECEA